MENETAATIILSIMVVIGGMVTNFQEFLMGSPATIKNLMVTCAYTGVWIFVLGIGTKRKNRGIIKYCLVFWMITLFLSILTIYINATGASANWTLPFVILFLGQWYGIRFYFESILTVTIIMTSISLIMFITSVLSLKCTK